MPHPKDIGQAVDALCDHAERMERELAVCKHDVKRLEAELETFDEAAIVWWCEYQDLKAKARSDQSEIDRELDACVERSARDWRPLPGDEPSDAERLQTETDDQAGETKP
jgi:predicted nuclease with TOPRIM domain